VATSNYDIDANRNARGPWEIFNVLKQSDGTYAFRTWKGRYWVANSKHQLRADRTWIKPWEKFRVECINAVKTIDCNSPFDVVNTPGTRIISPNHPSVYENNKNCQITIQFSERVRITFESIDIEPHRLCAYDYVEVRDGNNANSNLIGSKLCGNRNPAPIESSGQSMTLIFHTDYSVVQNGFKILTELVPAKLAPLYRYWKSGTNGDHFYTMNSNEIGTSNRPTIGKHCYKSEGIACRLYTYQVSNSVPLYRYWNSQISDHFYTVHSWEIGTTIPGQYGKYQYRSEGVVGYCYRYQATGTVPLYRYWNSQIGDHFYTTKSWEVAIWGC